jgi:ATP-binding cassette subfamily B protein RaxB
MLEFGFSSRTPLILQSEAAECGLACLAMVAGHHGHRIDLATLRARHNVSLRGSTLASLLQLAGELQLNPRPLRLEMEQLPALKLPCLIHWDLNHFVVLVRCRGERLTIHDPAVGQRELPLAEFSRHFTGVALELTPGEAFVPRKELRPVRLHALLGCHAGRLRIIPTEPATPASQAT